MRHMVPQILNGESKMKNRRILSVILAVILLFAVVPAVSAAESAADIVSEAAAIAKLDKVWAWLDAADA